MNVANVDKLEDWQKYVAVCFDEVKVKEGIVFDKMECRVVGFVDFGDVNNAISEYERSLDGNSPALELAKQMLVLWFVVFFSDCVSHTHNLPQETYQLMSCFQWYANNFYLRLV